MSKELVDMTFDEVVDQCAGHAILELIRGTNWRTIIYGVGNTVAMWKQERFERAKS